MDFNILYFSYTPKNMGKQQLLAWLYLVLSSSFSSVLYSRTISITLIFILYTPINI